MKAQHQLLFSAYLATCLPLASAFHTTPIPSSPPALVSFERGFRTPVSPLSAWSLQRPKKKTNAQTSSSRKNPRFDFALTHAATLSSSSSSYLSNPFSNFTADASAAAVAASDSSAAASIYYPPSPQQQATTGAVALPTPTPSLMDRVERACQKLLALSRSPEHRLLAKRAACTAVSCVTTWMLVHFGKLSIVRAAGVHAMAAALILRDPALCTASLSGTFCGMTGLFDCWRQVICLGLLGGVTLSWWEWPNRKIQVGKGGRLGTMGVLAHVLFFVLRRDARLWTVLTDSVQKLSPYTAFSLLAASGMLSVARRTRRRLEQDAERQPQDSASPAVVSAKPSFLSNMKRPSHAQLATWASKASIVCFLLARTLPVASVAQHIQSILSTFVCSLIVRHAPKQAVVFPVGVVCFIASLFHTQNAALMFDMAMGSFVGTTRLKDYSTGQLFQASLVATLLFYTAVAFKMGGRMGLFSFLGVGFGL